MKKHWQTLILIILISIALRLPTFLYGFVNIDENEYTMAAQKILAGGFPYKDFLIYQPPAIFFIYALSFWLSGGAFIWAAHIMTIVFVIGTIIALYSLVSNVTKSKNAGLASALAYGVFSTTFIPQDMLAANCEILMMFPVTLSVLALFFAETKRSYTLYILAGFFASFAILSKYQGGVIIAAEGFYLLIVKAVLNRNFNIKRNLIPSLMLTLGFAIPLGLVILYLWHGGTLTHAYEAFNYIIRYAQGPVQSDTLYVAIKFLTRTALFTLPGIIMWYGAVALIFKRMKTFGENERYEICKQFTIFGILWFFISFLPVIVGGRLYFHYYLVLIPPAAFLFGVWWNESGKFMRKWARVMVIIWLVICTSGWTAFATYQPYKKHGRKEIWIPVAEYMKEVSKPGETLFIWGYTPQIYVHSGLENGTRFMTTDYLTGRSPMTAGLEYNPNGPRIPTSFEKFKNDFVDPPGVVIFDTSANIFPKAWEYLKEDFEETLPTYIIDTSPSNYRRYARYPVENFPYLAKILDDNYEQIESINGFAVYKLR